MKFEKPAYEVSVGSSYWCPIISKTKDEITYETDVMEIPIIKTLGLSRTLSELKVYASGIMYDYLSQTASAEITLGAVALPEDLLSMLEGAEVEGGFTYSRTNDLSKEFAFGYWGENSDGSMVYFWHPVCKLVPTNENHDSKTENIPEPKKEYKIVILPFNGIWRVKYSTTMAKADDENSSTILTIDEFFAKPIYKKANP